MQFIPGLSLRACPFGLTKPGSTVGPNRRIAPSDNKGKNSTNAIIVLSYNFDMVNKIDLLGKCTNPCVFILIRI